MSPPRRPWTDQLMALVAQGVHEREQLIERATPYVPQGHAFRARELQRLRMLRQRADTPRGPTRPTTSCETHRVGARIVLCSTLHNLVRKGHLVRVGNTFQLADSHEAAARSEGEL